MIAGILGCLCWGAASPARAQDAAEREDREFLSEYKYMERLQSPEFLMPDLAALVLERMRARYTSPRHTAMMEAGRINGLVSQGKFEDALAIINSQAEPQSLGTWRMRLAMAEGLFSYNRYDEFLKLYQEFFKVFPKAPDGEAEYYLDVCYRFTQYLIRLKRFNTESLAAFRHLMAQPMPDLVARNIRAEMITQMLRVAEDTEDAKAREAILAEADKENDKQFWIPDARFGQAVVAKAHILKLRGRAAEAQKMVDTYLPRLREIHEAIRRDAERHNDNGLLRDSPMPQCRFLLASLLWKTVREIAARPDRSPEELKQDNDEILDLLLGKRDEKRVREANGAFNHFVNVFNLYPESQWALDAVEESEKVAAFIGERFGQSIQVPIGDDVRLKIRQSHFTDARTAFAEQDFPKAAALFESFLQRYAESQEGVIAHTLLAQVYAELLRASEDPQDKAWYDMLVDTLAGNLAERFANLPWGGSAAIEIRTLAEKLAPLGLGHKREAYYNLYFRNYPDDGATPGHIFRFAEEAFRRDDTAGALKYYEMLESQTAFNAYPDVLMRLSALAQRQGSTTNQMAYIDRAVEAHKARGAKRNELSYVTTLLVRANETRALAMRGYYSTNETERAESVAGLAKAAAHFRDAAAEIREAIKMLPDDPNLQGQLESAVFLYAHALEFLNLPAEKINAYRGAAIAAYEQFIKDFPASPYAARGLIQVGVLYTSLGDAKSAEAAFARLQREYPDSESAKNSVPLFAKSLMELGLTGEAVAQYRKMFAETGKFTAQQYLDAGQALLAARDNALALEAFDLVIAQEKQAPPGSGLHVEASFGRARALFDGKRYDDALAALTGFEKQYAQMERILDAWFLLVETHCVIGETEKDEAKRTRHFNAGVGTLKKIADHLKTPEGRAKTELAAALLLVRRMNGEKNMGLVEKARETCGKAAGGFLALMSIPPGNESLSHFLHEAYKEGIPLFIEFGAEDIAAEQCEKYLATFPEGKYAPQVRAWLNQSRAAMGL